MTGNDIPCPAWQPLASRKWQRRFFAVKSFALPQFGAVYMMGIKIEQGKTRDSHLKRIFVGYEHIGKENWASCVENEDDAKTLTPDDRDVNEGWQRKVKAKETTLLETRTPCNVSWPELFLEYSATTQNRFWAAKMLAAADAPHPFSS
jgi:hypothetical protein